MRNCHVRIKKDGRTDRELRKRENGTGAKLRHSSRKAGREDGAAGSGYGEHLLPADRTRQTDTYERHQSSITKLHQFQRGDTLPAGGGTVSLCNGLGHGGF